jgi:hypothetical protein
LIELDSKSNEEEPDQGNLTTVLDITGGIVMSDEWKSREHRD